MRAMAQLNKTADKIFRHLIKLCKEDNGDEIGSYTKIDNTNGTYMPVNVDFINTTMFFNQKAEIFAIAHYGEQNGDLMADPAMEFAVLENAIYPLNYKNDYVSPLIDEAMNLNTMCFNKEKLRGQVSFANMWLKNINTQQRLKVK